jgi:hypothetical protein
MALEMVFNELSLDSPAPNIAVAQQWMQEFIDLVRAAQKLEIRSLRTHSGFNQAQLASNYSIAQWRNDPSVDRERQRFFIMAVVIGYIAAESTILKLWCW